jgi:hypothetical protein
MSAALQEVRRRTPYCLPPSCHDQDGGVSVCEIGETPDLNSGRPAKSSCRWMACGFAAADDADLPARRALEAVTITVTTGSRNCFDRAFSKIAREIRRLRPTACRSARRGSGDLPRAARRTRRPRVRELRQTVM